MALNGTLKGGSQPGISVNTKKGQISQQSILPSKEIPEHETPVK